MFVAMESEKYICVRESAAEGSGQGGNVVIIDLEKPQKYVCLCFTSIRRPLRLFKPLRGPERQVEQWRSCLGHRTVTKSVFLGFVPMLALVHCDLMIANVFFDASNRKSL